MSVKHAQIYTCPHTYIHTQAETTTIYPQIHTTHKYTQTHTHEYTRAHMRPLLDFFYYQRPPTRGTLTFNLLDHRGSRCSVHQHTQTPTTHTAATPSNEQPRDFQPVPRANFSRFFFFRGLILHHMCSFIHCRVLF